MNEDYQYEIVLEQQNGMRHIPYRKTPPYFHKVPSFGDALNLVDRIIW